MGNRKNRILFVEDDFIDRMAFERFTQDEEFPYEYVLASSVQEAKRNLNEDRFDAIITDYQLGDGTAFELFHLFKDIPFIIITGTGNQEIAVQAMKQGAYDYLIKDNEGSHLRTLSITVNNAIKRKQAEDELKKYREHLEELVQERTLALQKEIEERKRIENKLRDLNEHLEQKVEERTLSLHQMNIKLSNSLKILREDEEAGKVIQLSLLPNKEKDLHGYSLSRFFQPSMYLSGDFLDYFEIDDNHIGFYMADVAGHGAPSAFITVLLKNQITNILSRYKKEQDNDILNPQALVLELNDFLIKRNLGRHIALFYGVIDKVENRLIFVNAGQYPYPILCHEFQTTFIETEGYPIGMFDFAEYKNHYFQLPKRFVLTLFSDGILEILHQRQFTKKIEYLSALMKLTNIDMPSLIHELNLGNRESLPDDITILMIKLDHTKQLLSLD